MTKNETTAYDGLENSAGTGCLCSGCDPSAPMHLPEHFCRYAHGRVCGIRLIQAHIAAIRSGEQDPNESVIVHDLGGDWSSIFKTELVIMTEVMLSDPRHERKIGPDDTRYCQQKLSSRRARKIATGILREAKKL
jgi:hypothetical protein